MIDTDVAAAICNAMQRWATVVVQKSIAEGFGLTVAEAMWKSRPVIGGAVGGIVDQIVPGRTGLLVDPLDLDAFGDALQQLLGDLPAAAAMGELARVRTIDEFLGDRHLERWASVLDGLGT
jgi:trehalose synthase